MMPVNDFPGRRGWGYDGVNLFAPARCYGTPAKLRELVGPKGVQVLELKPGETAS